MKPHPYYDSGVGHSMHPDDRFTCCHLPPSHPIHPQPARMSAVDRELLMSALAAYAAEHPAPTITEDVRGITLASDHRDTWTHVACMVAALRELGVIESTASGEPPSATYEVWGIQRPPSVFVAREYPIRRHAERQLISGERLVRRFVTEWEEPADA